MSQLDEVARIKADCERQLNELRYSDHQFVESLREEYDRKLQAAKDDRVNEYERQLNEMRYKDRDAQELIKSQKAEIDKMNKQIVVANLKNAGSGNDAIVLELKKQIESLQKEADKVNTLQKQISDMQSDLVILNANHEQEIEKI